MSAASDKVTLELSITDSMQLFNSMDPAPFHARDLDPTVVEYIVDWAEEQPRQAALSLEVSLSEETLSDHDTKTLREALRESFRRRANAERRRLARLFRDGRISLLIGVAFVAVAILVSDAIASLFASQRLVQLVQDSVVIAAWVALWHPVNIFLYDWWPMRAQAKLFDRLSEMDMKLCGATEAMLGQASA
jgi:hypothetical protein